MVCQVVDNFVPSRLSLSLSLSFVLNAIFWERNLERPLMSKARFKINYLCTYIKLYRKKRYAGKSQAAGVVVNLEKGRKLHKPRE